AHPCAGEKASASCRRPLRGLSTPPHRRTGALGRAARHRGAHSVRHRCAVARAQRTGTRLRATSLRAVASGQLQADGQKCTPTCVLRSRKLSLTPFPEPDLVLLLIKVCPGSRNRGHLNLTIICLTPFRISA